MKAVNEIVDQAVSDDVRLTSLLRRCLVVAAKLGNDNLRVWADRELNGYPNTELLPDYRVISLTAKGYFIGGFGAQLHNQPLPSIVLDDAHRQWATTGHLTEPISSYEALVSKDTGQAVGIDWPADLTARYQRKFIKNFVLNRAWQEIPMGAIISLVDTVRTRLLQFALEIQREIGTEEALDEVSTSEKVDQAVRTIIYGGNNIIGDVKGGAQLIGQQVVIEGDFASLAKVLEAAGVTQDGVAELERAIETDKAEGAENGFGSNVARWLVTTGKSAARAGANMAGAAAQHAFERAIFHYFGI